MASSSCRHRLCRTLTDDYTPGTDGPIAAERSGPQSTGRGRAGHPAGRAGPKVPVPDAILSFLASQLRGNVRELEGTEQRCAFLPRHRAVSRRGPGREALADLLRHAVRVVRPEDVDRAVCAVLNSEPGTLQNGPGRVISHPRMLAAGTRAGTATSYAEIGGHFGGRNHSTTVAAGEEGPAVAADGCGACPRRRRRSAGPRPDPDASSGLLR